MNKPIKVILKTEPVSGNIILFLPDSSANPGYISYCSPTDGHGEASTSYYLSCKPYKGLDADKWLSFYANYGEFYPVIRAYKQSTSDRAEAYAHLSA